LCLLLWYASLSRRAYLDSSPSFFGNAFKLQTILQHVPQFMKFKQHIQPQQNILNPHAKPRSVKYSSFSMGMQGATMDATSWITGAIVLCGGFIGLSPIRTNDFYLVLPNSLLRPQCGPTQIVAFGGVSFRLASSSSAVGSLPCFLVRWWGFALELEDAFELESAKRFSCNLNNRILARQIWTCCSSSTTTTTF
jgi:hypothetical protein